MTTALLIIDIQHALCVGEEAAFGIVSVIEKVNALSRRARAAASPVILIQHEEDEGLCSLAAKAGRLPPACSPPAKTSALERRLPNSFHGTDLHRLPQERGVSRVVICGLQADFCVDTTVRQALPLG